MDIVEVRCTDGRSLRLKVKDVIYKSSSPCQEIAIYDTEEFGKCLFLDGVIQSSEKDHDIYDEAILRKLRASNRDILVLGGGDGYIAKKALALNPDINITIVDLDEEVVRVCSEYLSQEVFNDSRVKVVIKDALEFVRNADGNSFDGLISDLTDFPVGYDNRMRELFSNIFERARIILRQKGWISLYGGVKGLKAENNERIVDLLSDILKIYFHNTECSEVLIPSFGEPCYLLYGNKE